MSSPLNRRALLQSAAGIAAGAVIASKVQADSPTRDYSSKSPIRYPDPDIVVLDKRFAKIKIGNTAIQRLATGMLWAEGPAWSGVGKYFLCSDIPNDRQMRWLDEDGHFSVFRKSSGNSNGNTFDRQGRQISCEHGNRRVVRYEHNGKITVLADRYQGKRFNAPNDAIVHPDGSIWFTDPGYGSLLNYEGHKSKFELEEAVYRIDKSGKITKLIGRDEMFKPNGICFSPDLKKVYVADTGASHDEKAPRNIMVFDLTEEGKKVKKGKEYVSMEMELNGKKVAGFADGIRADTEGNIWVAGGWVGDGYDGVHVFAPDGARIGLIKLPEICSNVCFGGEKRNRLFMTAGQSVYAVYVEAQGAEGT